ncbi:threonine/homoserine/homoserine lactone efflux protein [Streptomonospora nanhaiensis]|uniref:Threonine/homoserine/homoserine lactone efflux protein n=1 Tax=Streptomonospora nanhaiensis TaxID=1323731 RepID=A0A853BFM0_9ACTN|nr:LysE family translocator [Streptomonospora nanhaiensis]NYI94258.1 threonine/homoserine/homoserine lactone efflux protein [Streptomonospora nanhaiensis]
MDAGAVVAFQAVSLLLVCVPGADWAFAIGAGLRHSAVAPAVSGLVVGYLGYTALVAAGVGAVIARSPHLLAALTWAGAAYLIWLGAAALVRPAAPPTADGAAAGTGRRALAQGIGVTWLNPKALLLYLALLPQFADPAAPWPMAAQIGLLGALHTLNCGVVYFGVGTLARLVLRTRPAAARAVSRLAGAAMVVIGVSLLAERLLH